MALDVPLRLVTPYDRSGPAREPTSAIDRPVRGVGWVLRQAAVGVLLAAACAVLVTFACCLSAEQSLSAAAQAGAREATLPRATLQSVRQAVHSRLADRWLELDAVDLWLDRNGQPVTGLVRARTGDRLAVTLGVPLQTVVPRWLAGFVRAQYPLVVEAQLVRPAADE